MAVDSRQVRTDANGAKELGGPGVAILVEPGGPDGVEPGSFPVQLVLIRKGTEEAVWLTTPRPYFVPPEDRWDACAIRSATPLAGYSVLISTDVRNGFGPSLGRTRKVWNVKPAGTVVTQVAPAGDDAARISTRAGWSALNLYLTGAGLVDPYQRSAGGVWYPTGEASLVSPGIYSREVFTGPGDVFFRAQGAGVTMELDAQGEV